MLGYQSCRAQGGSGVKQRGTKGFFTPVWDKKQEAPLRTDGCQTRYCSHSRKRGSHTNDDQASQKQENTQFPLTFLLLTVKNPIPCPTLLIGGSIDPPSRANQSVRFSDSPSRANQKRQTDLILHLIAENPTKTVSVVTF